MKNVCSIVHFKKLQGVIFTIEECDKIENEAFSLLRNLDYLIDKHCTNVRTGSKKYFQIIFKSNKF